MLLAVRVLMACALVATAVLGFTVLGWETSLAVAVAVMAVYVAAESIVFWAWVRSTLRAWTNGPATAERSLPRSTATAYAEAARTMVTTQGVVLGLVAFKGGAVLPTTTKLGACSLAGGVLVSLVLYFEVAEGPPITVNQAFAASLLFTASLWALSFGLVCLVAGMWAA